MTCLRGRAGGNIGRRTRNAEIVRFCRLNRTAEEHLTDNVNLRVQVANTRANESLEGDYTNKSFEFDSELESSFCIAASISNLCISSSILSSSRGLFAGGSKSASSADNIVRL
ncbi:hypothetical protein PV328_007720 [Microctonus aethiopoides]|uniref:Uncharacterized protein n=1 Tax=Microctonus aethiopoides TaxID=144406 RepID=A0AA39EZ04_9HYME|nr:hypothetical protein PV328_007720 [Microctonus aethiopoides]